MVAPDSSSPDPAPPDGSHPHDEREARLRSPEPAPDFGARWASSALLTTGAVACAAKLAGVVIAPGLRGVAPQRAVDLAELASATLAYAATALLVALICIASFEIAKVPRFGVISRTAVVSVPGLVIVLASPAVVQRLHSAAALLVALLAGLIGVVAGLAAARPPHTRALGSVLALLSFTSLLRAGAWEVAATAGERASLALYQTGRGLATLAVVVQGLAFLLAWRWLATRSRWRGWLAANVATTLALMATYFALRATPEAPSALEAVFRASLSEVAGLPGPYGLGHPLAVLLVPASTLLAAVALAQPLRSAASAAMLTALALTLLSNGAFDVPLQALAATAAAQWAMLAAAVSEPGRAHASVQQGARRLTPHPPAPSS